MRQYAMQNREQISANFRRRRYGLTRQELESMYREQGKRCAICSKEVPLYGKGCMHLDHDHGTGEVRELLCHSCNVRVGVVESKLYVGILPEPYPVSELSYFMTDTELARPWVDSVVAYIEKWEDQERIGA
jgi:hypothetical protein